MTDRPYDLVLYGATGFVGRLAAAYLAQHAQAPRWAIAGRDGAALETLRARLTASGATRSLPGLLVADTTHRTEVDAMVSQTHVMISTAGPFARFGDAIVDACVRHRTHYADITGETAWVRGLIDTQHAAAERDGTRIVPFCGFDSIPSDLGALLLARFIRAHFDAPCTQVTAYFRLAGGFNGGTLASNFERHARGDARLTRDPFLLDPDRRRSYEEIEANRDPLTPRFDDDLDAWVAPFIMGPINTRVVRRSAALLAQWGEGGACYAPQFRYQEWTRLSGPLTGAKSAALAGASALFDLGASFGPTRRVLQRLVPAPGRGPTEPMMERGWFKTELVGRSARGDVAHAVIGFRGDPGNRATVRMLCESGLLLASGTDALPGGAAGGGVLTPATALGEALVPRLQAAGFQIEVAAGPLRVRGRRSA
ncbi:MAG: saccharopine dehydrogenase NADP-binding domain-containing protein [Burkholderiaceae bacterium]|nr:saccharopine dehydrogenase NADP-binding domain-containing protein [Burkholderiaceae bacterium]